MSLDDKTAFLVGCLLAVAPGALFVAAVYFLLRYFGILNI